MRVLDAAMPSLRAPRRAFRAPISARLGAVLAAGCLDRELASGIASWSSPARAARARHLTSARSRRGLAASLQRLLTDAERGPAPFAGAVVRPCRPQVLNARPALLAITRRLDGQEPVDPRGVAQLKALLTDGSGPCYVLSRPDALRARLLTIDRWLDIPQ